MTQLKDIPREYDGFTFDPDKHMYFEVRKGGEEWDLIKVGSITTIKLNDDPINYNMTMKILHVVEEGDIKKVFSGNCGADEVVIPEQTDNKIMGARIEIADKDGVMRGLEYYEYHDRETGRLNEKGVLKMQETMDKTGLPYIPIGERLPTEYLTVKDLPCIIGHIDTNGFPVGYVGVPKANKHHGKSNEQSIDGVVFEYAGKRTDIRLVSGIEDDGYWYFGFDYGNNTNITKQDLMDDFEMYAGILLGEPGAGEAQAGS